jgi:hypothetical protein
MRRLLACALLFVPAVAHAQTTTIGPPRFVDPLKPGDASGDAAPAFLFEPLRLGLQRDVVPHPSTTPGCEPAGFVTAEAASFVPQHAFAMRLVPNLTLVGFGRGGCAYDGAVGGGFVWATPLSQDKKTWLSLSGGALYLPHYGPNGTPVSKRQLRGDVVFDRGNGRSLSVGLGTHGISIGGLL